MYSRSFARARTFRLYAGYRRPAFSPAVLQNNRSITLGLELYLLAKKPSKKKKSIVIVGRSACLLVSAKGTSKLFFEFFFNQNSPTNIQSSEKVFDSPALFQICCFSDGSWAGSFSLGSPTKHSRTEKVATARLWKFPPVSSFEIVMQKKETSGREGGREGIKVCTNYEADCLEWRHASEALP